MPAGPPTGKLLGKCRRALVRACRQDGVAVCGFDATYGAIQPTLTVSQEGGARSGTAEGDPISVAATGQVDARIATGSSGPR